MRIRLGVIAVLMVPAMAAAQVRGPTPFNGTPLIERMQANVAKVTVVGEKQRWQANVTMWQTVAANPEGLSTAELTTLKASLLTMQTNVATIERPAESQRWHANVVLWRTFIAGEHATARPAAADSALARMKANVARITEPAEKERWQANLDLWTAMSAAK